MEGIKRPIKNNRDRLTPDMIVIAIGTPHSFSDDSNHHEEGS